MSTASFAREYLRECLAEPHWMRYETALRRDVEAILDALDAVEKLLPDVEQLAADVRSYAGNYLADKYEVDETVTLLRRALGVDA